MKRTPRNGLRVVEDKVVSLQTISSEQAEIAVINCLVFGGEKLVDKYINFIQPDFFTDVSIRTAYRAILAMRKDGLAIESGNILIEYFRKVPCADTESYLQKFFQKLTASVSIANTDAFVEVLARKYRGRKLQQAAFEIFEQANNEFADPDALVTQMKRQLDSIQASGVLHTGQELSESVGQTFAHIQELIDNQVEYTGIRTGFRQLDKAMLGCQKGDSIVIGAASSMGKTALALSIADWIDTYENEPVFISSQEQRRPQLEQRFISIKTGINLARLRAPMYLSEDDRKAMRVASEQFNDSKIIIEDKIMPPDAVTSLWVRAQEKYDCKLFILDYLQYCASLWLREWGNDERLAISQAARHFKLFAAREGCEVPVILLSQIKREAIAMCKLNLDHRPDKEDLDGSSTIEKDADVVIIVHRPFVYNLAASPKTAELLLVKQRNGETGVYTVQYNATTTHFRDRGRKHLLSEE